MKINKKILKKSMKFLHFYSNLRILFLENNILNYFIEKMNI